MSARTVAAILALGILAAGCGSHRAVRSSSAGDNRLQKLLDRRSNAANAAVIRAARNEGHDPANGAMCETNHLQSFCSIEVGGGRCEQFVVAFYAGRTATTRVKPPVGDPCATPTFESLGW